MEDVFIAAHVVENPDVGDALSVNDRVIEADIIESFLFQYPNPKKQLQNKMVLVFSEQSEGMTLPIREVHLEDLSEVTFNQLLAGNPVTITDRKCSLKLVIRHEVGRRCGLAEFFRATVAS